jgi:hypothetical protein
MNATSSSGQQQFALDGHDPTQPLFLQGRIPTPEMTCASAALSMIQFPYRLVDEIHHERLVRVIQRFATVREMFDRVGTEAEDAWLERFGEEAEAFHGTGELPLDPLMRDTVLANMELRLLVQASRGGEDERELREALAACDDPDEGRRAAAVARVQDLVRADRRRDRDRREACRPAQVSAQGPVEGDA